MSAQVRFLVLKNLAAVLAEDNGSAAEALGLYGAAAQLDGGDIVLWNRMGSLVWFHILCSSQWCLRIPPSCARMLTAKKDVLM